METSRETDIGVNLRVTAHSNQGGREYMEDILSISYQSKSTEGGIPYAFFAIFDGHGGHQAAHFAKKHLKDFIVSQKNFWSDDDELVKKAISDGFMSTHSAMWSVVDSWPKTARGYPSTAGTTASVLFVRLGKIYVGHVGDSKITLGFQRVDSTEWQAQPLTTDHKPGSAAETERITDAGGKVMRIRSGTPRVVWSRPRLDHKGRILRSTPVDEVPVLAVARALGDLWSYNSARDLYIVSPIPDVSVIDLDVTTHRCLILGSDGLWDKVTCEEAVSYAFNAGRHGKIKSMQCTAEASRIEINDDFVNPSKELLTLALNRWFNGGRVSGDNISVITVYIDPPASPKEHEPEVSNTDDDSVQIVIKSAASPSVTKSLEYSLPPSDSDSSSQIQTPSRRRGIKRKSIDHSPIPKQERTLMMRLAQQALSPLKAKIFKRSNGRSEPRVTGRMQQGSAPSPLAQPPKSCCKNFENISDSSKASPATLCYCVNCIKKSIAKAFSC